MNLFWPKTKKQHYISFFISMMIFMLAIVLINYLFPIGSIANMIVTLTGIYAISYRFLYPITRGKISE